MSRVTKQATNATTQSWVLILFALASALLARVFTTLGAPSALNFAHFAVICGVAIALILTSSDKTQLRWLVGLGAFLGAIVLSAIWNEASPTNVVLYFLIMAEPFLLIAAIASREWSTRSIERFKRGLLLLLMIHLFLAYAQWSIFGQYGDDVNSPLKKASLTGFHATAKHIAAKAVSPSSETMRTI